VPKRNTKYPQNWKAISLQILSIHGFKCAYCGVGYRRRDSFTVHHIDHDTQNNVPNNLVPLHTTCHFQFHNVYNSVRTRALFEKLALSYRSQLNLLIHRDKGVHLDEKVLV